MIKRALSLANYKQSFFLFGPRQVGKTYLLKHSLSVEIYIELLKQSDFQRFARDASLLSGEIAALGMQQGRVIIDEIQRLPELLNEVQLAMESFPQFQFILTGSSARKLKRAGVNMLGGRAITLHLYPFSFCELLEAFVLKDALRFGLLPRIYLEKNKEDKIRLLKSYLETYLKEEIQQEALIRNVPAFSHFLELAAHENGNILNFQNIARETGVHSKTIKEYFIILEDTLLGFMLYPYLKSTRTKLVSHPKFYFFDPGVVSALKGELAVEMSAGTPAFGRAFEHFIVLEIKKLLDYREREGKVSFFRTTDGAEVDIVLEIGQETWAIEIKASAAPRLSDVRGMVSFIKDHPFQRAVCVCLTPRAFTVGKIEFLPWQEFLQQL